MLVRDPLLSCAILSFIARGGHVSLRSILIQTDIVSRCLPLKRRLIQLLRFFAQTNLLRFPLRPSLFAIISTCLFESTYSTHPTSRRACRRRLTRRLCRRNRRLSGAYRSLVPQE